MEQLQQNKLRVLVFVDYYLPGYKAGGPLKTISNIVDQLGDEISFKIITSDRDFGDDRPYFESYVAWRPVGKAMVSYLSPKQKSLCFIRKLLSETDYDILYLNSLFSAAFTIYPLLMHKLSSKKSLPVIIASRGEASPGAIQIKSYKKVPFLFIARETGLYNSVKWHASNQRECEQLIKLFHCRRMASRAKEPSFVIAPDLVEVCNASQMTQVSVRNEDDHNPLNIVFLSRIARKKNLDGALRILQGVRGNIKFDIYGPIEDQGYWSECEELISLLPSNIEVNYQGPIDREAVLGILQQYHLFFLPTWDENFGHVILEALVAGCPILISDQTPWRDLENKGVGWDIPLERPDRFQSVLEQCINMDHKFLLKMSKQAMEFGIATSNNSEALVMNRNMFFDAWNESQSGRG